MTRPNRHAVVASALFTAMVAMALLVTNLPASEQAPAPESVRPAGADPAKADSATLEKPLSPGRLIFCDGFEYYDGFGYKVKRDEIDERPAFLTQGKWSAVKSINAGRSRAGSPLPRISRFVDRA